MNKLSDNKPAMHQLIAITDEWRKDNHVDKHGIIIFQNKETLANIRFTNDSFHAVAKNPRGAENLPETVKNPTEIWSYWSDANQRVTMRNYILSGSNGNYIVTTKDGLINSGIFVVNSSLDKYRKGLILLR
jgi:hypothetical protein